jgi:hypothetical protein
MTVLYVLGALLLLAAGYFLLWRPGTPGVRKAVDAAIAAQDPAPVVEAASRVAASRQPEFYEEAIVNMWEAWHRPLAVRVIKAFSLAHSDKRICQYWLKQAIEVEPMAARKELDEQFLKLHYNPEVAASCCKGST